MLPTTGVITTRTKSSGKSFPGSCELGAGRGREPGQSPKLGWELAGRRAGQTVGAAFEPVIRLGGTGVSFLSALNSRVAWAWSQSTATPAFEVW
jgi:hypothetical protein